ncbi:hypothetical protein [Pseudomonas sp. PDM13]|uniref:hypothetical protein n=1 Tax=Pseudomonas sp. PDM13 TaxID=2769255 RepID=UPI0021E025B8|nr:hypothetical protein [Pseudomonas sp. PDM13]MCU9946209.1 hypothetical protein [Pseudomonas sp. PDM13]
MNAHIRPLLPAHTYRVAPASGREKGTDFEALICAYLRDEATYRDLYDKVWMDVSVWPTHLSGSSSL